MSERQTWLAVESLSARGRLLELHDVLSLTLDNACVTDYQTPVVRRKMQEEAKCIGRVGSALVTFMISG